MKVTHFDQAVINICERDSRIDKDAYDFLKDALDYASDQAQETGAPNNHVSASDLLAGIRDYALKQFGPMAATLFAEWNVTKCSDFGDMVFNLIDEGIFSKQESDNREDFIEIFDFKETFETPFLPKRKLEPKK